VSSAAAVPVALNAARARGYLLFVITNQPDVARESCCRALVDVIRGLRPQVAAGISIGEGRQ
jgi:hypothetical protein